MMKKMAVNAFYFLAGIIFLILAKIKSGVAQYSPKTFAMDDVQKCVDYDINIVDDWMQQLKNYAPDYNIENKHALELGPGSDLGVGLYLLSKSVKKYTAVDVYDLVANVSTQFYDALFEQLENKYQANVTTLIGELDKTKNGHADRLNYICNNDFNLEKALGQQKINLVFSNAAFEHFNDVTETVRQLSSVADTGTLFIVSVDLRTHSRWIRDKDPNNIYRYPNILYKLLSTRSSPNRVRPYQYKKILEDFGWANVVIKPIQTLQHDKLQFVRQHLNKQFQHGNNQMEYLTIQISATKA
jgi:hypothetical protein